MPLISHRSDAEDLQSENPVLELETKWCSDSFRNILSKCFVDFQIGRFVPRGGVMVDGLG